MKGLFKLFYDEVGNGRIDAMAYAIFSQKNKNL